MAINTSTSASAAISQMWEKNALEKLVAQTHLYSMSYKKIMPAGGGKTINWVRFPVAAADLTPNPEGTIPAAETMTPGAITATLQQYVHAVTFSDLLKIETFVKGGIEDAALQYVTQKMQYTIDKLAQAEVNSTTTTFGTNLFAGNGAASIGALVAADVLKASDMRRMTSILSRNNAPRYNGNKYKFYVNSSSLYDLRSESGTGSFLDLSKYTDPGYKQILEGFSGEIWQTEIFESSLLPSGPDGAAGITVYYSYMLSDQALGCVELEGRNMKILRSAGEPSVYNVGGTVGGAVAANYSIVFKNLSDAGSQSARILRIGAASAI